MAVLGPEDVDRAGARLRKVLLAVLAASVVVIAAIATMFGTDARRPASALIGNPVPRIELVTLDGQVANELATFRPSGGVLVVNFWAPWCSACIAEHLELNGASVRLAAEPIQIVGIPVHSDESDITRFLRTTGQGYPVLLDPTGRAPIEFGVFSVPETFLIGPSGTVVARITGPVDADLVSELSSALLDGDSVDSFRSGPTQAPP